MKYLFSFALMTAFVPTIASAGTLPRWIMLTMGLVGLLSMRPVRITWAHIAGALFVAWAVTSLAWSGAWFDSIDAVLKLLIVAGIFALGSTMWDMRPIYLGAAAGIGVSSLLVLTDLVGFRLVPGQWGGGLFVNPLFLAEAAALVAAGCLGRAVMAGGPVWPLVALLPAIVVPLMVTARSPVLALAIVGWLLFRARWPKVAFMMAVIGAAAIAFAIGARPMSVAERVWIWWDTIGGMTWLGHGYGSFFGVFPEYARNLTLERYDHAHSALIEIAFEFGPIGVVLIGWLFWLLLRVPLTPERLVLVAFIAEGFFAFPDRLPATAGFAAFVAGYVAGGLPCWRDALGAWRVRLCARDGGAVDRDIAGCADGSGGMVAIQLSAADGLGAPIVRLKWSSTRIERLCYRGDARRFDGRS